ncbi:MAG: hypothetical protein WBV96_19895 [Polyangia bacterium]
MTTKSKSRRFPLPKLLRARRIVDHEAMESVRAIAKIAGAGAACRMEDRVGFRRSKKLKGLIGQANCFGKSVTLLLRDLTRGEAVSVLQTLVFVWPGRKSRRQGARR